MSDAQQGEGKRLLRLLASSATPGPWRCVYVNGVARADVRASVGYDHRGKAVATAADSEFGACPAADAEFIAAASPDVVLALLAEIEELRSALPGAEGER